MSSHDKIIYLKIAVALLITAIVFGFVMGATQLSTSIVNCLAVGLISLLIVAVVICVVLYFLKKK